MGTGKLCMVCINGFGPLKQIEDLQEALIWPSKFGGFLFGFRLVSPDWDIVCSWLLHYHTVTEKIWEVYPYGVALLGVMIFASVYQRRFLFNCQRLASSHFSSLGSLGTPNHGTSSDGTRYGFLWVQLMRIFIIRYQVESFFPRDWLRESGHGAFSRRIKRSPNRMEKTHVLQC